MNHNTIPDELWQQLKESRLERLATNSPGMSTIDPVLVRQAGHLLGIRSWNRIIDALDTLNPNWRGEVVQSKPAFIAEDEAA